MRPLRVYGWHGWRSECPPARNGSLATREIAAVASKAALYRLAPGSRPSDFFCLTETGNDAEIACAMSEPGVIFWRPLDEHRGEWAAARRPSPEQEAERP